MLLRIRHKNYESLERVVLKYLELNEKREAQTAEDKGNVPREWSLIKEQASLALATIYTRQKKTEALIQLLTSDFLNALQKRNDKIFEAFAKLLRSIKEKLEIDLGPNLKITKIFSYYSAYACLLFFAE